MEWNSTYNGYLIANPSNAMRSEASSDTEGGSDALTSGDVNWNVDDNIKHHVANGSGGSHKRPCRNFGFDPDDPKFYSSILPFLKQVIDEGSKYNEINVPEGKVMFYVKSFADQG